MAGKIDEGFIDTSATLMFGKKTPKRFFNLACGSLFRD
jgi:hypothetical protein